MFLMLFFFLLGLHDSDICDLLNESDLDLTDEDDSEIPPEHHHVDSISSNSGSSTTSDSDEEIRPESEVSLVSSTVAPRGRSSTRRPRTRGGRRFGFVRTRGRMRQNVGSSLPVNNDWTGVFSPLDITIFQPRYNFIETDTWTDEDFITQYINDTILQQMVDATNRTYLLRQGKELKLSLKELKSFIGMLLINGLYKSAENQNVLVKTLRRSSDKRYYESRSLFYY